MSEERRSWLSGTLMPFSAPSFSPVGRACVISTVTFSGVTVRMMPPILPSSSADRFAGADAIEKFGKRDADARRADQLFFLVVLRGLAGIERPREYERVADVEPKRLRLRRNCSDAREAQGLCDSSFQREGASSSASPGTM